MRKMTFFVFFALPLFIISCDDCKPAKFVPATLSESVGRNHRSKTLITESGNGMYFRESRLILDEFGDNAISLMSYCYEDNVRVNNIEVEKINLSGIIGNVSLDYCGPANLIYNNKEYHNIDITLNGWIRDRGITTKCSPIPYEQHLNVNINVEFRLPAPSGGETLVTYLIKNF